MTHDARPDPLRVYAEADIRTRARARRVPFEASCAGFHPESPARGPTLLAVS